MEDDDDDAEFESEINQSINQALKGRKEETRGSEFRANPSSDLETA